MSSKTVRSITSNWLLLAVNIGVSFFMSPFVVSKLGSTYYGIWAISLQFTGYLYLLDFGVRESVIRYTAKYVARQQPGRLNQVLNTAILIYVPISLGCAVLACLAAWAAPTWFEIDAQHAREAQIAVLFVGLTIAQAFALNVYQGILQGLNRFDVANAVGLVATVIRTVLIVVALSAGFKIAALSMIQFAMAILSGLACAVAARKLLRTSGIEFSLARLPKARFRALSRKVFGYGFYVLVNNIAQKINFASDAVVIGIFMPVSAVTPYAIAGSLIEYLRSLIVTTAQVFSPLSSTLHAQRKSDDLAELLVRGSRLTVAITLPISLTFAVLGQRFIELWMGPEYTSQSGQVLLVLGLLQIVSAPHYVISSVLYGMSQHGSIAWVRVGEAAFKLGLSIYFVQTHGIIGVAWGTAISHCIVVLAVLPGLVQRHVGLTIAQYFLRTYPRLLLAAAPFLAGAFWIDRRFPAASLFEFFAQVACLCVLYVGSVYVVALSSQERQAMLGLTMGRFARARV
jgi:O-antigen/teichoic acid export membrane protein